MLTNEIGGVPQVADERARPGLAHEPGVERVARDRAVVRDAAQQLGGARRAFGFRSEEALELRSRAVHACLPPLRRRRHLPRDFELLSDVLRVEHAERRGDDEPGRLAQTGAAAGVVGRPKVVDFAELRDFIDAPVKTYSSGMYMRLGFAVAIHVDPDVLLVDEVLAVGDEAFTHRCLDKFAEFRRRNRTVLLVTHALPLVERLCDEAVWLDAGQTRAGGDPRRVADAYVADVDRTEGDFLAATDARTRVTVDAAAPAESAAGIEDLSKAAEGRWGSREVEVSDVTLLNARGEDTRVFHTGEAVTIGMTIRARRPVEDFVFGIGVFNADGVCVYGTNTDIEDYESVAISGIVNVDVNFAALELTEGTYKVDVAVHSRDGVPYDYHRLLYTFRVKSRTKDVGIYRPKHAWEFSLGVTMKPKA